MRLLRTENVIAINEDELECLRKLIQKYIPVMSNRDQSTARVLLINLLKYDE